MKLLDYAKNSEKCQRNWNHSAAIPDDHIDYIIKVCTTMPTKQNLNIYQLHAITNNEIIKKIYDISYDPKNYADTFRFNSQTSAPLLLVWSAMPGAQFQNDVDIAVGISSGAAALAASELGYKTGFCKCFENRPLRKILKIKGDSTNTDPILILGIGLPNDALEHNAVVLEKGIRKKESLAGKKNIKVSRI